MVVETVVLDCAVVLIEIVLYILTNSKYYLFFLLHFGVTNVHELKLLMKKFKAFYNTKWLLHVYFTRGLHSFKIITLGAIPSL